MPVFFWMANGICLVVCPGTGDVQCPTDEFSVAIGPINPRQSDGMALVRSRLGLILHELMVLCIKRLPGQGQMIVQECAPGRPIQFRLEKQDLSGVANACNTDWVSLELSQMNPLGPPLIGPCSADRHA